MEKPETQRCRLYQDYPPSNLDPHGHFVEVWDSLEEPWEQKGSLPKGTLLVTEADPDSQVVRRKINEYEDQHNIVLVGLWGYHGP